MGFFKRNNDANFLGETYTQKMSTYRIKDMMIERAIDLISKTISRTKFEVYRKGKGSEGVKRTVDTVFYTLNLRPNKNEDASSFWKMVVSWLLRNGDCLVIIIGSELFMASDWEENEKVISEKTFTNITLIDTKGNTYDYNGTLKSSEVIYMTMGDHEAMNTLNDFYEDYDKVISTAISGYRHSNAVKRLLNYPGRTPVFKSKDGSEKGIEQYAKELTSGLFDEENSLTTLPENFTLEDLKQAGKTTDDFRNSIKEFGDKVANAFGIPLDIYYGTKTDKSTGTNDFITFAVLYPCPS